MASKKKKKKAKKKKLSPAEKAQKRLQRKFYTEFRTLFRQLGFAQVKADGVQIEFQERHGEFDDIFIYENVLILVEYTVGQSDSAHLLKKKPLFDKISANVPAFVKFAEKNYPQLSKYLRDIYDGSHFHIRIIYASLSEVAPEVMKLCPEVKFLQGGLQKYFLALAKTIHKSARVEFFSYLGLRWNDVGEGVLASTTHTHQYTGHLLPDSMSSFPPGFKIVSFYADPESLIVGAYVLRRDGWRDSTHLYQRILVRSKIGKMRRYLVEQKRVFVNNVIVTLPDNVALNDATHKGANISPQDLNKAQPITISLPVEYGTVGIIDGQHRVFCYHEGDDEVDTKIAVMRKRQHLLVTGIIYSRSLF